MKVDGGAWHASLTPGQVVLLENCRFNKGEKKNDDALAQNIRERKEIAFEGRP